MVRSCSRIWILSKKLPLSGEFWNSSRGARSDKGWYFEMEQTKRKLQESGNSGSILHFGRRTVGHILSHKIYKGVYPRKQHGAGSCKQFSGNLG